MFSIFTSAAQMEFSTNPNYSASSFMGNILWFALAFLAYTIIYKVAGSAAVQQKIYLFMFLPPILGYTLIPFGAGLREKIYYKFYELGNNGFYVPTPTGTDEDSWDDSDSSNDEVNIEG